ncbi:MAG: OmpA family protein [Pseudomonadales bacterium]
MDSLERELRKLLADSGSSVTRVRGDIVLTIAGPGVFESDRAEIGPAFQESLGALASLLSAVGSTLIEVTGFTDATGPMIANLALSLARAERIAQVLATHGVPKERVVAKGLGPLRPIADNDTPEGRQLNRRVELTIGRLPGERMAAVAAH